MAKRVYKIPDTLAKKWADTPIVLSTRNGTSLKPLPIKIVGGFVGLILLEVWLLFSAQFMAPSPLWLKLLLGVLVFVLGSLLLWPDYTGNSRYTLLPALIDFMQVNNRKQFVRRVQPANNFMHVSGIKQIVADKGLIEFVDGSYGFAYRVVGNASVLLFDEDRDEILDRTDNFYRKMKPDYQLIYITAKEPQHVTQQLNALANRRKNLDVKSKDLKAVANMQYRTLHDVVGMSFRSIHQYLIIKGTNPETLMIGKNMLMSECGNSSLMFREAEALYGKDLDKMLGSIYKGKESV